MDTQKSEQRLKMEAVGIYLLVISVSLVGLGLSWIVRWVTR